MSVRWTHALCDQCWVEREGAKTPHRLRERDYEVCCACQRLTTSGIYVRSDPSQLACLGEHAVERLAWVVRHRGIAELGQKLPLEGP